MERLIEINDVSDSGHCRSNVFRSARVSAVVAAAAFALCQLQPALDMHTRTQSTSAWDKPCPLGAFAAAILVRFEQTHQEKLNTGHSDSECRCSVGQHPMHSLAETQRIPIRLKFGSTTACRCCRLKAMHTRPPHL